MRVILTDTEQGESYKFDLDEQHIEGDEFQTILPEGDGFKFYSAGYVYRLVERSWDDFDDPPTELIEKVMTQLQ
jgi:hypothetical protein